MATLKLLLQVAFRNLFKSWVNFIIGGIILFATFLVVTGGALLDSIDSSMSRSIIGSIAGHLQVYSDNSQEELALFGGMGGEPNVSAIDKFSTMKAALEKHPNVQTVVPMGTTMGMVSSGNTVDLTLARLRSLYRKRAAEGETPELRAQSESLKQHIQHLAELLADEQQKHDEPTRVALEQAQVEALKKARSADFWADFDKDPFGSLEFLENELAPEMDDGWFINIRCVGTDLETYQKNFDRMQIVDGQTVPPGRRGIVLAKYFYEDNFKLKTARRMDLIKEARDTTQKKIATDPQLQRYVKENSSQTRELLFQLDAYNTRQATARLQELLASQETDLSKLLSTFLTVTDENFDVRYKQFYEKLVPLLDLYRLKVGDILTITTFTRTGYVLNVNVPIYGTYQFKGLEKSPLAGGVNLMDLESFRDLYGYLTDEKLAEIAQIQATNGSVKVKRESAEDTLFGEQAPSTLVTNASAAVIDDNEQLGSNSTAQRNGNLFERVYSKKELEDGMVLSAAVILKDPSKLDATLAALQQSQEIKGLKLRAVNWQQAAGLIGQFVRLMKMVLWGVVIILFLVVLAIINNAVMMATIQRVREVGTMRAIGAQRSFILTMILLETVVLGLVFGGVGAGAGSALITFLGKVGIPAGSEEMYFFFSGPQLLPTLSASNLITALVLVVGVSLFSTFYPAFLATRVSPVTAMQADE